MGRGAKPPIERSVPPRCSSGLRVAPNTAGGNLPNRPCGLTVLYASTMCLHATTKAQDAVDAGDVIVGQDAAAVTTGAPAVERRKAQILELGHPKQTSAAAAVLPPLKTGRGPRHWWVGLAPRIGLKVILSVLCLPSCREEASG
jgi:hypothetical protein